MIYLISQVTFIFLTQIYYNMNFIILPSNFITRFPDTLRSIFADCFSRTIFLAHKKCIFLNMPEKLAYCGPSLPIKKKKIKIKNNKIKSENKKNWKNEKILFRKKSHKNTMAYECQSDKKTFYSKRKKHKITMAHECQIWYLVTRLLWRAICDKICFFRKFGRFFRETFHLRDIEMFCFREIMLPLKYAIWTIAVSEDLNLLFSEK